MVILRALRALRGCEQTRAHPNDRLILDVATLSSPPPPPPPPAEGSRPEGSGGGGVRARAQGGDAPGCMATRCAFCSPFDMFTAIQEADSLVAHGEGLTASEVRRRTGNGIGLTLSIRSEKGPQALATA